MPSRWRIKSPDDVFRMLTERYLPRWLSDLFWNVSYIVAWITLPLWFVSTVSDFQLVVECGRWLIANSGVAAEAIRNAFTAVGEVVRAWRAFLSPVSDWLSAILPWRVPRELTELLIACIPLIPALGRCVVAMRSFGIARRSQPWGDKQDNLELLQWVDVQRRRFKLSVVLLVTVAALMVVALALALIEYLTR